MIEPIVASSEKDRPIQVDMNGFRRCEAASTKLQSSLVAVARQHAAIPGRIAVILQATGFDKGALNCISFLSLRPSTSGSAFPLEPV